MHTGMSQPLTRRPSCCQPLDRTLAVGLRCCIACAQSVIRQQCTRYTPRARLRRLCHRLCHCLGFHVHQHSPRSAHSCHTREPAARAAVVNIQRCWCRCSVLVRLYVYCSVQLLNSMQFCHRGRHAPQRSGERQRGPQHCCGQVFRTTCDPPTAVAVGRGRFAMLFTWLPHCPTWTVMTAGT